MDALEQIRHEVNERAGSDEGLALLIHLLLVDCVKEYEIDTATAKQYADLLTAYIIANRKMLWLKKQAREYSTKFATGDNMMKVCAARAEMRNKHNDAQEFAAQNFTIEQAAKIKRQVGRTVFMKNLAISEIFQYLGPYYNGPFDQLQQENNAGINERN